MQQVRGEAGLDCQHAEAEDECSHEWYRPGCVGLEGPAVPDEAGGCQESAKDDRWKTVARLVGLNGADVIVVFCTVAAKGGGSVGEERGEFVAGLAEDDGDEEATNADAEVGKACGAGGEVVARLVGGAQGCEEDVHDAGEESIGDEEEEEEWCAEGYADRREECWEEDLEQVVPGRYLGASCRDGDGFGGPGSKMRTLKAAKNRRGMGFTQNREGAASQHSGRNAQRPEDPSPAAVVVYESSKDGACRES